MTVDEESFLQAILQERDRLFRETSRLKSQLTSYENFESERISYQKLLSQNEETINSLKRQIEMLQRKIWGKSSERYVNVINPDQIEPLIPE
jgi:transposase